MSLLQEGHGYIPLFKALLLLYSVVLVNGGKAKLGIVNERWQSSLDFHLKDRELDKNIEYMVVPYNAKSTGYESLDSQRKFVQTNKITHLIGDFNYVWAITAASLNISYFVQEGSHSLVIRNLGLDVNIFQVSLRKEVYAFATVDLMGYFHAKKVAVIVKDNQADEYHSFLEPYMNHTTLSPRLWMLHETPADKLEEVVVDILRIIREDKYETVILKVDLKELSVFINRARYMAIASYPFKWIIPGVVCQDFGFMDLGGLDIYIYFVSEKCSMAISIDAKAKDKYLIGLSLDQLQAGNWVSNPYDLKQTLDALIVNGTSPTNVTFNDLGERTSAKIGIYSLYPHELNPIGWYTWNPFIKKQARLEIPPVPMPPIEKPTHMTVIGVEEHPHLFRKKDGEVEGFGVDIVELLANDLKFTYSIYVTEEHGALVDGKWTGMVEELLSGRADMTLGPLVQSSEREEVIDFTTTFKQREISLVMHKPVQQPSFFQFLAPFSMNVWLCVLTSVLVLSFVLFFVEKVSACIQKGIEAEFNLRETTWFVLATHMQGGTETVPRSIPGRILTGTLYFFVLILITSYTANLAAFLTVKASTNPISSVDDLANLPVNGDVKFGTVINSGVADFFKHSEMAKFRRIYRVMAETNPSWMVNSSVEGYRRALEENYVFIWDDSVNQYEVFNEADYQCLLTVIGRPFGKRSFAIGLPQGSLYREYIDKSILKLIENGDMEKLIFKWWQSKKVCVDANDEPALDESQALSIQDIAGVFLVLLGGTILAILAVFFECIGYSIKRRYALKKGRRRKDDSTSADVRLRHEMGGIVATNEEDGQKLISAQKSSCIFGQPTPSFDKPELEKQKQMEEDEKDSGSVFQKPQLSLPEQPSATEMPKKQKQPTQPLPQPSAQPMTRRPTRPTPSGLPADGSRNVTAPRGEEDIDLFAVGRRISESELWVRA